jgi:hypothetical protein
MEWRTDTVPQMQQHAVSLLDIIRLEARNQSPDQLSELGGREGTRGILGIDK